MKPFPLILLDIHNDKKKPLNRVKLKLIKVSVDLYHAILSVCIRVLWKRRSSNILIIIIIINRAIHIKYYDYIISFHKCTLRNRR